MSPGYSPVMYAGVLSSLNGPIHLGLSAPYHSLPLAALLAVVLLNVAVRGWFGAPAPFLFPFGYAALLLAVLNMVSVWGWFGAAPFLFPFGFLTAAVAVLLLGHAALNVLAVLLLNAIIGLRLLGC